MEQVPKLIPNRLRKHRRLSGYTQKQVAYLIGVKNAAEIARWEKGIKLPNTCNAFKLSALYRTFLNELYFEFIHGLKQEIHKREHNLMK